MTCRFAVFWVALLLCTRSADYFSFNFVVWNVGQGAWSTWIENSTCYHFDMGGERVEFAKVERLCHNRSNVIFLTHLDWDHISFIKKFHRRFSRVCLYYPKTKKPWLESIAPCTILPRSIRTISMGSPTGDSNASSIVYLIRNRILITGDAPMAEEKKWYRRLPQNLAILLLGHHGSKTSTSVALLNWARPGTAIASARRAKYGHPHNLVRQKLRRQRIPLLSTESSGNIFFEIR